MKKRLICIILAVAVLCSVTAATVLVYAENTARVPDSGNIGDAFDLPTIVDGKTVSARVTTPSGATYSAKKLELSEIGRYTVEYFDSNGDIVATKYCVAIRRPTDMFTTNNYAKTEGIATYKYTSYPKLTGVKFTVSPGASITLDREIDMTNRTKNDVLSSIVIEPAAKSSRDFGRMILTFADVDDPSVYFTVITTCGNQDTKSNGARAYVRAGGNGQLAGGYEDGKFNTTDIYGAKAPFSFQGDVLNNATSQFEYALKLCYDSDENALYLANGEMELYGKPYRIVDFDDVSNFGTNIWEGFPSGKAKLTITFDYFVNNTGSVIITEADGIDFSQKSLPDTEEPTITVDMNGETRVPNSFIGATYKLFEATAQDFYDQQTEVFAKVYFVNGDSKLDVPVQNGAFVTDRVGKYEIVYSSMDKSGNLATETVTVYCVAKHNEITFKNVENTLEATVFDTVTLTSAEDVRCTGGNGQLTKTLTVYSPQNQVVELIDDSFVPIEVGTYRAEYKATDFFGEVGFAVVDIEVGATEKPIFVGAISLPEVLINGFTYDFPTVAAKSVQNNQVYDAVVKYFVDGQEITNGKFTVDSTDTVTVECRAYGATESDVVSLTKEIHVVDGDKGKSQQNYFYSADANVTATLEKDYVVLNVLADGSTTFANKLSNGSLEAKFSYKPNEIGFSSIDVTLSAANNMSKTVTFNVVFSSLGLSISTKGLSGTEFDVKSDANYNYFAIKYDAETYRLSNVNDKVICVLKYYDDGTAFEGFDGGIYLSVKFNSVKMASQLFVTGLNNQSFGYKYEIDDPAGDVNAPQIIINGVYNRRQELGSTLTIYTATAFDVLNQVQSFSLSVYDPDNNAVLSNVSPNEIHTLTLDKIGRYRIIYSAKDTSGNNKVANAGTTLTVLDNVAPELTVEFKLKDVYKVGSKITLPKFTVTDNTENVYCDVYLQLPNNETRILWHCVNGETTSYLSASDVHYPSSFKAGDDSFVLEMAGKYVISYIAYDDAFNYVRYSVEFTAVDTSAE